MERHNVNSKFLELIVGIMAICVPIAIGAFMWPEIKTSFLTIHRTSLQSHPIYIYYEIDDEIFKIAVKDYQEFESDLPMTKIQLTFNGEYFSVPLSEKDRFIQRNGANNVTLSVIDDDGNVVPELSDIHRVPGY